MGKTSLKLLFLSIFATALCTSVSAAELTVNQSGADGAFTSIGAAIQAATDGDVIIVGPGRYEETLNIDKQLTIRGSGVNATELISLFGNAIVLTSNKPVSIRNLLISAGGHGILAPVDLEILRDHTEEESRFINIENCIISDCGGSAIRYESGGGLSVRNSIIKNSGQSGVVIRALPPSQVDVGSTVQRRDVYQRFPTNAAIINSVLDNNGGAGISIWNSNDGGMTVVGSIISNNGGWGVDNYTRGIFHSSADMYYHNYPPEIRTPFQTIRVTYSCVWNNQSGNYPQTYGSGVTGVVPQNFFSSDIEQNIYGSGVIEVDPMLDDNLNLLPDSPARNAGDPSGTQNNTDGTRNSMGAFGGPGAANWILDGDPTPPTPPGPGNGEFVRPVLTPALVKDFNASSAAENGLLIAPPGQPGEFDLADVFFNLFTTGPDDAEYTDGFGMSINLAGGRGATIYGTPVEVGDDIVYLRVSVRATGNAILALGGLDAQPALNLAGAALNGSLGVNFMVDASRFVNGFGVLEALYKTERGAIVPVIQAVPASDERVTVQFDNLEIYRISYDDLPIFGGNNGIAQASVGSFRIGDTVIWSSK